LACGMQKYRHGYITAKQYGDEIEFCLIKTQRTPGLECDGGKAEKGTVNDEKLANNIARAVSAVRELGRCNPWTLFFTGTFAKEKINRYALDAIIKAVAQWIRDYNKKHGTSIKYLLVPEKHKDGAWHVHGLLYGLPMSHLKAFTLDEILPYDIRDKLKAGRRLYNWLPWAEKFGHCDVELIRDKARSISYITKYITKSVNGGVTELGKHMYLASQGLERAVTLKEGFIDNCGKYLDEFFANGFENEYVRKISFNLNDETALNAALDFMAQMKTEHEMRSG